MRFILMLSALISPVSWASDHLFKIDTVSETVYVESPTDTDADGKADLIYVSINRPFSTKKLSTIYSISPYALGGNEDAANHPVDSDLLPQDELLKGFPQGLKKYFSFKIKSISHESALTIDTPKYAQVRAHSLGTGKSTGCPTVGDLSETLAAKSVIDWLNGRARGFYADGSVAKADWANGIVGMTGTSYDGTLPIMVATTGVEGLKAIVPIAAISNWYDYYRANGLVVNPGGYIGEDADVLGYFIVRKGTCDKELQWITKNMGRENGDFTNFWKERDHLSKVKNIKAATFIIHGQNDWNVKQKHAIQLWEALEGVAPRRLFLHKGGHGSTTSHQVPKKLQDWFDHYLENEQNGINEGPQVEVELPNGSLMVQEEWPNEETGLKRFYFSSDSLLSANPAKEKQLVIKDNGKTQKLESLLEEPQRFNEGRLIFMTSPFLNETVLSGTSRVNLSFSILNRKAANLTIAIVEYDQKNRVKVITRGWADPQNYQDINQGELLIPGRNYQISFDLEPKQYRYSKGSRLGVVLALTDYEYTLRPNNGTLVQFNLGEDSFIDLHLSKD